MVSDALSNLTIPLTREVWLQHLPKECLHAHSSYMRSNCTFCFCQFLGGFVGILLTSTLFLVKVFSIRFFFQQVLMRPVGVLLFVSV